MKKKILPILGLMALSLAACGEREVTLKDYEKTLDIFAYKDTVRIMQIADLHWSMKHRSSWHPKCISIHKHPQY